MNTMMKTLTGTLVLSLATMAWSPAAHAAEADHPERLMFLVSLLDRTPTRAMLVEAGANKKGEGLVAIVRDGSLKRYPRARAAAMLGFWPEAKAELVAIIDSKDIDDDEIKIQAIAALTFSQKQSALGPLQRLLDSPNLELRNATARALSMVNHPSVDTALDAKMKNFWPRTQRAISRHRENRQNPDSAK